MVLKDYHIYSLAFIEQVVNPWPRRSIVFPGKNAYKKLLPRKEKVSISSCPNFPLLDYVSVTLTFLSVSSSSLCFLLLFDHTEKSFSKMLRWPKHHTLVCLASSRSSFRLPFKCHFSANLHWPPGQEFLGSLVAINSNLFVCLFPL